MSFHAATLQHAQNAPLVQSHAFGAALNFIGRPPLRIALRHGPGEVQVSTRRFGPVKVGLISRVDVPREDFARVARHAECGLLLLNPESDAGAHGVQLRTAGHVAELSIKASLAEIRASMKQKWRNRLNRADGMGLKIAETALKPDASHWLLEMEEAQARLKGYANWPRPLTLAFAKTNRAQARLFEVRQTGHVIAAMLFLCHGSVATYHIGWSGPAGRAVGAHHALIWAAIERLKSRGVERLDLGTVETDRAPGLARFKLGTGAELKRLGGSWLVMPRFLRAHEKTAEHLPRGL